jgi:hypothetical protein
MGVTLEDIAKAARDGITTSIGLGVLLFQRAQVCRHEIKRTADKVLVDLGGRHHKAQTSD